VVLRGPCSAADVCRVGAVSGGIAGRRGAAILALQNGNVTMAALAEPATSLAPPSFALRLVVGAALAQIAQIFVPWDFGTAGGRGRAC